MSVRYESKNDLPVTVRRVLPEDAQQLYLEGYQRGWDDFDESKVGHLDRRSVAHRQGWALVEHEFVCDQGTGKWYHKGQEPGEEGARAGFFDRLKGLFGRATD